MLLCHICGWVDGFFTPDRPKTQYSGPIRWERQDGYAKGSFDFTIGGTLVERQRGFDDLHLLADAGLLEIIRGSGAKRRGVRLTAAGDWEARGRANCPTLLDAWPCLEELAKKAKRGAVYNGCWVPEVVLLGLGPWDGREETTRVCVDLEWEMAPLLIRGLAISNVSIQGHGWYAATEQGREAAVGKPPVEPENLPDFDDEHSQSYMAGWRDALNEIKTGKPHHLNELGRIPLPVSVWPDKTPVKRRKVKA